METAIGELDNDYRERHFLCHLMMNEVQTMLVSPDTRWSCYVLRRPNLDYSV